MSILDKVKKNSTIKDSSIINVSKFFTKKDMIQTNIPVMNIALSGRIDGGFVPGLTIFAGPSKHFKSMLSLIMAKSYMDKYPEAAMVFYDCEYGTPLAYFESLQIDMDRVLHVPIMNMEEFKFDCIQQLEKLERGDKVIFVVDSLGNMSSKKELDDALEGKAVADMSRAKQMKSIFRMITPYLNKLDIPMVAVNHIYMELGLFPSAIVSGGQGLYLSSDTIFIIGRNQQKEGTDLVGYNFIINIEKSRFVREKSKIPLEVSFEGGISKWSGLLDIALESGHVVKPKNGWYSRVNLETGKVEEKSWRRKATSCKEFWEPIITTKSFNDFIHRTYQVSQGSIMNDTELDGIVDNMLNDEENEIEEEV
jgi:RecA/RadA recombinase